MALGYRRIARVAKTHGIKGEVVAVPAGDLPAVLTPGLEVCIVPPALAGSRFHEVLDVETSDAGQLISLSDISSTSEAHEIVGKYLLAKEEDLNSELLDEKDAFDDLLGLEVIDERLGLLGVADSWMLGSVQDILVVSSDKGETLIPWVEELIWLSDDESHLECELPRGLVSWDTAEGDEI